MSTIESVTAVLDGAEYDMTDAVLNAGRPPMKETDADRAVRDRVQSVAGAELRQLIERAEQVESEIADSKADLKEVFAEAKGRGYDTKAMRKIIALRKRDADDVAEEEAILDMYKTALGMA